LNVGRNKTNAERARAAEDYVEAFRALAPHAQLASINVSSPNTPGLRALQAELGALVAQVTKARDLLPAPRAGAGEALAGRAGTSAWWRWPAPPRRRGPKGSSPPTRRWNRAAVRGHPRAVEQGGLSGAPLRERALHVCRLLYRSVSVPIVGVGGIFTAEDAYARIRAGASLVQIYTALVYEGPGVPRRISRGLADLLRRDGLSLKQRLARTRRCLTLERSP